MKSKYKDDIIKVLREHWEKADADFIRDFKERAKRKAKNPK